MDPANPPHARLQPRARRLRRRALGALLAVGLATGATVAGSASPAGAEWPPLLWFLNPPKPPAPAAVPEAELEPGMRPLAAATTACGGVTYAKPGGGTWECTFSDEFTGSTLDRTKWVPQQTQYSGFSTGVECFLDDKDNVSVASGALRLTARKELSSFLCQDPGGAFRTPYTSGMVSTWYKFSQAFGRFEIRAKFPASKVKGLQSALWLWPDDALKYGPWPHSGEIDIAEVYSAKNDRAIPHVHYASRGEDHLTNNYCTLDPSQYHTYVAEWTESGVRILFDGKVCLDHTWNPASPLEAPQPFDHPFMIGLTQGFGVGTNAFTPGKTKLPATTYVDYVRVWE